MVVDNQVKANVPIIPWWNIISTLWIHFFIQYEHFIKTGVGRFCYNITGNDEFWFKKV